MASFLVYLLLILAANLIYQETFYTALFVASSGYVAQDLSGNLKMILKLFPVTGIWALDSMGVLLLDAICYGGIYTLLFFHCVHLHASEMTISTTSSRRFFPLVCCCCA